MTTSGTVTYNASVQKIIDGALRDIGLLGDDETTAPGTSTIAVNAIDDLNQLIKTWQAAGMHVWSEEEGILFAQPGQYRYLLGSNAAGAASPDNSADAWSYATDTLAANAGAGALAVTLVDSTGYLNGQKIGVQLASGAMFWTTINGAPVGNVVTLAQALPSPASAGAISFSYATQLSRPLRLVKARAINFQGPTPTEIPITLISRQEYMDLPAKQNPGAVTQAFYAPKTPQGELYLWNVPQFPWQCLRFTWLRSLYDVTDPTQTVDCPQEWILPLRRALAEQLGPKYGVDDRRWAKIVQLAQEARDVAASWDRESEDVQFGMDWSR